MIEARGIAKIYNIGRPNEVVALKDINVSIEDGTIVAFAGPSGCGKTTLVSILGLILTPTRGSMTIDGEDVTYYSDYWKTLFRRKNIGFIYQHINLFPHLTALENALIPLLSHDVSPAKYKEKAIELFKRLGIVERLNFSVEELSGGEQQRVAVARALITDPKIVIADEPIAFLDAESARIVLEVFDELRDAGKTVIASSHSPELVKTADKIYSMKDGRILAS